MLVIVVYIRLMLLDMMVTNCACLDANRVLVIVRQFAM